MSNKPHDTPTEATAEKGEVMLDGPGGLAMSLTADAASKMALAIADAASKAGQQVTGDRKSGGEGTDGQGTDAQS